MIFFALNLQHHFSDLLVNMCNRRIFRSNLKTSSKVLEKLVIMETVAYAISLRHFTSDLDLKSLITSRKCKKKAKTCVVYKNFLISWDTRNTPYFSKKCQKRKIFDRKMTLNSNLQFASWGDPRVIMWVFLFFSAPSTLTFAAVTDYSTQFEIKVFCLLPYKSN